MLQSDEQTQSIERALSSFWPSSSPFPPFMPWLGAFLTRSQLVEQLRNGTPLTKVRINSETWNELSAISKDTRLTWVFDGGSERQARSDSGDQGGDILLDWETSLGWESPDTRFCGQAMGCDYYVFDHGRICILQWCRNEGRNVVCYYLCFNPWDPLTGGDGGGTYPGDAPFEPWA